MEFHTRIHEEEQNAMGERRDEQKRAGGKGREERVDERGESRREDDRDRVRDEGLAGASYGSTERDQTIAREEVRGRPLDEIGEFPNADADVEAGVSRRAERYED